MFRLLPTIFVFSCLSEKDSRPFVFARGLLLGGMEDGGREERHGRGDKGDGGIEDGGMEEETKEK